MILNKYRVFILQTPVLLTTTINVITTIIIIIIISFNASSNEMVFHPA